VQVDYIAFSRAKRPNKIVFMVGFGIFWKESINPNEQPKEST